MIGSLSELFGKNFIVGYLLPALLAVAAFSATADLCGLSSFLKPVVSYVIDTPAGTRAQKDQHDAPRADPDDTTSGTSVPIGRLAFLFAASCVLAVLLLATNYSITRLLEGYGTLNPFAPLRHRQLMQFRHVNAIYKENKRDADWARAAWLLALNFPEEERLVLPTRFGNIMRAFERYPQVIYAIEPMQIWARLEPIIPDSHRRLLEDAKSQLDFWLNMWFGAFALALFGVAMLFLPPHDAPYFSMSPLREDLFLILGMTTLLAYGCSEASGTAAVQYGLLIKSAFDLYRDDLAAKLGLMLPRTLEQEREMWAVLAWTTLNRDGDIAKRIDRFRSPRRTDVKV